jgi:threonylcarbamoyladenosine tRNA methylthiotransferase MtaB
MKIHLDTIGCRLNQSEIETLARQFDAAGHDLVGSPDKADLTVVNTCDVTVAAAADSRKKIRAAARAGSTKIVVTGCWATMNPGAALGLPSVSQVVLNEAKDSLVPEILQISPQSFELEPMVRKPIPGSRLRTRAFIKVQDGCDNRCTFCITTIARGQSKSISVERILQDIDAALLGGAQEIVLTGVHLGSWGQDFGHKRHLRELVEIILARTSLRRLRLSSLEPWDLDDKFFLLWKDKRLARHLHLPLQSGSAATLRRMARKITPDEFSHLVDAARSQIPDVAITTDIITGFPGETQAEFTENLKFIQKMKFADGHVFTYSERPGTAARKMADQISHTIRKARNAEIRSILAISSLEYSSQFLGQTCHVLWETAVPHEQNRWMLNGLTDNYLRVVALSTLPLWNQFSEVQLTGINDGKLVGDILESIT